MEVSVKADGSRVVVSLGRLRLGLQDRAELMKVLGAGQLVSIYRTFDEQGPGWPPLSPSSEGWMGKSYAAGHMLLQRSGRGKNSIGVASDADSAVLGTSLFYMRIQNEGWSDTQNVSAYQYVRSVSSRDQFGRIVIKNKLGRQQTVRRKLSSGIATVSVHPFSRHITIPPRPFMVFRPEDPERMRQEVELFVAQRAQQAGLDVH